MDLEPDIKPHDITVYLQKDTLLKMLYAWVSALRYNLPSISRQRAVEQFYQYYNINEAKFIKQDSAIREIYRLEKHLREWEKQQSARSTSS